MAKPTARPAAPKRSRRLRECMTPSQIRAYLLARETLRRAARAAAPDSSPPQARA
jgi:hypothetical protein